MLASSGSVANVVNDAIVVADDELDALNILLVNEITRSTVNVQQVELRYSIC